jgi:hypothetical protein
VQLQIKAPGQLVDELAIGVGLGAADAVMEVGYRKNRTQVLLQFEKHPQKSHGVGSSGDSYSHAVACFEKAVGTDAAADLLDHNVILKQSPSSRVIADIAVIGNGTPTTEARRHGGHGVEGTLGHVGWSESPSKGMTLKSKASPEIRGAHGAKGPNLLFLCVLSVSVPPWWVFAGQPMTAITAMTRDDGDCYTFPLG